MALRGMFFEIMKQKDIEDRINSFDILSDKTLDLSYCELTTLLPFKRLKYIKRINLSHNYLSRLDNLDKIQILYCGDNELEEIPPYKDLRLLHCENNFIKSLPSFERLESLDIRDNCIDELPQLLSLVRLKCDENISMPIYKKLENFE
jgi:Leucine-rich repeat (LRR) protein